MRTSGFTEAQIIGMLKEQEAGMDVSDARRLRQLEEGNGKPKRLLADSMLERRWLTMNLKKLHRIYSKDVSDAWREHFRSAARPEKKRAWEPNADARAAYPGRTLVDRLCARHFGGSR